MLSPTEAQPQPDWPSSSGEESLPLLFTAQPCFNSEHPATETEVPVLLSPRRSKPTSPHPRHFSGFPKHRARPHFLGPLVFLSTTDKGQSLLSA